MAQQSGKKLPDFNVAVMNRENEVRGRVGAAWANDDGSISIALDPFVVLKGNGHGDKLSIQLFPRDYKPSKKKGGGQGGDDDIPF